MREGKAAQAKYQGIMRELLVDVRARAAAGQLPDSSIAGHLLRLRQINSDAGFADDVLLPEVGVFFFGGRVEDGKRAFAETQFACIDEHSCTCWQNRLQLMFCTHRTWQVKIRPQTQSHGRFT